MTCKWEYLTEDQKERLVKEFHQLPQCGNRGLRKDRQSVRDLARLWNLKTSYVYTLVARAKREVKRA